MSRYYHRAFWFFLILMISAGILSGCRKKLRGSGVSATRDVYVSEFSRIKVSGTVPVDIVIDSVTVVQIIGDDNIIPEVNVRVSGDILRIRGVSGDYKEKQPLKVLIHTPKLEAVKTAGTGKIGIKGLNGLTFELKTAGTASVNVSGEVTQAKYELAGAGRINARHLKTEIVEATIAGAGNICVYATTYLDATIAGVGKIDCYGKPASVNRTVSGIGSVNIK